MNKKIQDFLSILNGFRKFSIILAVLLTAIVFRAIDFVNGAEFVDLVKYTAVAFFGTNSVEHMTKVIKEWISVKAKKELG